VPVFVLSSSETSEQVGRAFELRADSFFVKPAGLSELQNLVGGMLGYWYTRYYRRLSGPPAPPRS